MEISNRGSVPLRVLLLVLMLADGAACSGGRDEPAQKPAQSMPRSNQGSDAPQTPSKAPEERDWSASLGQQVELCGVAIHSKGGPSLRGSDFSIAVDKSWSKLELSARQLCVQGIVENERGVSEEDVKNMSENVQVRVAPVHYVLRNVKVVSIKS